jgi:DNA polymerase III sliding clamp (beta) subunit (PCNA family)
MDQLKLFGDTIQFECSETAIQLTSHSQDCGKMKVDIPIDDLTSFAINEGESMSLSYSLTHLHNICLYSKIAPEITIHMSDNFPIKMVFSVGSTDSGAQIVFYLAPKLSEE